MNSNSKFTLVILDENSGIRVLKTSDNISFSRSDFNKVDDSNKTPVKYYTFVMPSDRNNWSYFTDNKSFKALEGNFKNIKNFKDAKEYTGDIESYMVEKLFASEVNPNDRVVLVFRKIKDEKNDE